MNWFRFQLTRPMSREDVVTRPRVRSGFTLLELLMVLAIILILATMGMAGWNYIKNRARARVAEQDCQQIAEVMKMYYMHNGVWPVNLYFTNSLMTSLQQPMASPLHAIPIDKRVFNVLSPKKANTGGGTIRTTRYLSGDKREFNANGLLADPWGNPYLVRYDLSGTNAVPNPFKANELLRFSVIVFTAGPDGLFSTNAPFNSAVNKDNITSWGEGS